MMVNKAATAVVAHAVRSRSVTPLAAAALGRAQAESLHAQLHRPSPRGGELAPDSPRGAVRGGGGGGGVRPGNLTDAPAPAFRQPHRAHPTLNLNLAGLHSAGSSGSDAMAAAQGGQVYVQQQQQQFEGEEPGSPMTATKAYLMQQRAKEEAREKKAKEDLRRQRLEAGEDDETTVTSVAGGEPELVSVVCVVCGPREGANCMNSRVDTSVWCVCPVRVPEQDDLERLARENVARRAAIPVLQYVAAAPLTPPSGMHRPPARHCVPAPTPAPAPRHRYAHYEKEAALTGSRLTNPLAKPVDITPSDFLKQHLELGPKGKVRGVRVEEGLLAMVPGSHLVCTCGGVAPLPAAARVEVSR